MWWAEKDGSRAALPKEGTERRSVGGGLNTGMEKKVKREKTERAREEGTARGNLLRTKAALHYWLQMAPFTQIVAG